MANTRHASYLFRLAPGASPEQRKVTRQVMSDLNAALGSEVFGLGHGQGQGPHLLTFKAEAFVTDPEHVLGYAQEGDRGRWAVAIRPYLTGAALYTILCHELGHVLGLEHAYVGKSKPGSGSHVMNPCPSLSKIRTHPHARMRLRFASEIAASLAKKRLKAAM